MAKKKNKAKRKSKEKGTRWELEGVRMFKAAMPGEPIYKGSQHCGGDRAPDVEAPGFWPEFRNHKRQPSIMQALRDATAKAAYGRWPFAAVKKDYARPTGTMWLDDFFELIGEWWAYKKLAEQMKDPDRCMEHLGENGFLHK